MNDHCMNTASYRVALNEMPLSGLYAILDESFEPDSSVDINDVLIALEIIEQRIGKNVSPQLDAAWEKIKKEYLR